MHVAEEIVDYLPLLSGEQQAAVLHVVKTFAETVAPHDAHTATVLRRLDELQAGSVEGAAWDDVKKRALAAVEGYLYYSSSSPFAH